MSQHTQPPQYPQSPEQFPDPGTQGVPVRQARNGLGVASLILGIIGALSGIVPFLFWLAGTLGLLALILGLVGRSRAKRGDATNKGVAVTGAILGVVGLILAVVGVILTFMFVGDVVKDVAKSSSPKHGPVGKPLAAGDTAVYDDGLSVTVSAPKKYSPSDTAVGHTAGNVAYQVTVTLENTGKKKANTTLFTTDARAGAKGTKAEEIIDGKVGGSPGAQILPGKTVTVTLAYDTPPAAKTLDVSVSPDILHDEIEWDLKL